VTAPVGVGVLGYGYWGATLARNLAAASSTELVAIADADPDRRAAATSTGVKVVDSLDDLLVDDEVNAVVIATPASLHVDSALRALRAGRHVLVEKPLAMDPESADEVVRVSDEVGRVLMVGHTFLYAAPVRTLRAAIDDGELGAVQYLYSQRLSLGRIRRDCNAMWNFAPHDVSIMLYLIGERVVEVSATGFAFIQPDIDDVCFASLTFESGIGANLHVSWIDPRKTRLMTVVGDRKMAIYNDVSVDQKLWIVDAGVAGTGSGFGEYESLGDFQWRTRAGDIVIPHIEVVEPLLAEMQAFGDACASGVASVTDGRHGAEVVRVLHAIDESARQGGAPVKVVP
jgi:predicted dehydrogenase